MSIFSLMTYNVTYVNHLVCKPFKGQFQSLKVYSKRFFGLLIIFKDL